MSKNPSIQEILNEISQSKAFDRLNSFKDFKKWQEMTGNERKQLALLFISEGEFHLKNTDRRVFESFEWASTIASEDADVFFRQGIALSSVHHNSGCLASACTAFQKATTIQPHLFQAWVAWGEALQNIGILNTDGAHFQDSLQKFQTAQALLQSQTLKEQALFFWKWGKIWFYQGKYSGEAHDFHSSLEKYREAMRLGISDATFWYDCGCTVIELAFLIRRKDLFFEGVDFFGKAVEQNDASYEAWLSLAYANQCVYELCGDQKYFSAAHQAFTRAVEIQSDDFALWLKWGQLFVVSGKINRDIEQLRTSFEKFVKANAFEPNHPAILTRWGEAEMLLGINTEQVDLIRTATQKIIKSLELAPEQVETWTLYGTCLNELGRYFGEEKYYIDAIEMYQHALSLNQRDPLLWHGLALTHFALGELNVDSLLIEKAVRCFSHVVELGGHLFPQFWNDWGVALMKLSELTSEQTHIEAAIQKFEQVFSRVNVEDEESIEPEWLYNYGCALDFLGDYTEDSTNYEKAVEVLTRALTLEPEYYHARYNLALALSHLGEASFDVDSLQKASELFDELLTRDAEDEMAWNDWGLTLLHLAQLVHDPSNSDFSRKYFEEAESKFLQAVALGLTASFYNLACLYSLTGNIPAAMHYIEKAETSGSLPQIEDLMHDEWLHHLRQTPAFRQFVSQLTSKEQKEK